MKAQLQRTVAALSLAACAAAVVAAGAQADRPDDRAGMLGVGAVSAAVSAQPSGAVASNPNDRSGMLGVGGVAAIEVRNGSAGAVSRQGQPVQPDDRGGRRGPGPAAAETPTVTIVSHDGFQWGDAAFGAAATFGLLLLGTAATLVIRHRGRVILH